MKGGRGCSVDSCHILLLLLLQIDCLCCRKWGPDRVQSYNDLEELLFHVDETTGGRLAGIDEEGGITVCNFFCDVLKQKPKRPTAARLSAEEILQDQNVSRFSEPLL